jgi:hypothetical protein
VVHAAVFAPFDAPLLVVVAPAARAVVAGDVVAADVAELESSPDAHPAATQAHVNATPMIHGSRTGNVYRARPDPNRRPRRYGVRVTL